MPGQKVTIRRYCRRHGVLEVDPDAERCTESVPGRRTPCLIKLLRAPPKERDREQWMGSLVGVAGGPLPADAPPSPLHPDWLSAAQARRLRAAGRL